MIFPITNYITKKKVLVEKLLNPSSEYKETKKHLNEMAGGLTEIMIKAYWPLTFDMERANPTKISHVYGNMSAVSNLVLMLITNLKTVSLYRAFTKPRYRSNIYFLVHSRRIFFFFFNATHILAVK